jgi:hypothetical protein
MSEAAALLETASRPLTFARTERAMAAATLPFTCPDGYLPVHEAFEQACSVLIPGYDEMARRIHAPITANPDEAARKDEEWIAFDAHRRVVALLLRDAFADRRLTPYARGPTGATERAVMRNPEEWRRESFGIPDLDCIPDGIFNPAPRGGPYFVEIVEFSEWLTTHRQELDRFRTGEPGGESPTVAGAAESTPDPMPGTKRGRRQYDFWPAVENHIFDLLTHHGRPSPDDPDLPNLKALEERVAVFLQRNGWDASESTIRAHVAGMLEYWGSPRPIIQRPGR